MIINPYRYGSGSTDPDWANVGILLHFDSGTTTTPESSSHPRTWTIVNTGMSISTAQKVFGPSSLLGTTSDGGLTTPLDTTYITASGSTPWTIEFRLRLTSVSAAQVLWDINNAASNTSGWQIYVDTDAKLYIYSGPQGISYGGFGTGMSLNTWYACAVTWDGTNLRFFRGGSLLGSNTGFTNVWGGAVYIGNSSFLTQGMRAYMDEFRWTKSVARYTASYTPAATAFAP